MDLVLDALKTKLIMSYKLVMRKFCLILFMCLPFVLFSQTADTVKPNVLPKIKDTTKTHKFEIGFSFSPEYSYRTLKANGDEQSQLVKQSRDTMEIAKFGFTGGVNVAYRINKNIVVETGILFADKGEKTKKMSFSETAPGQSPIYITYKYNDYYLDIPIKANYYIQTGKLKLYVTAGVSANIFLTQKTTILQGHSNSDYEKTTFKVNPGFNRFNLAVLAGAGLNLKMTEKMNLKVEPVYTRCITSIINAPVKAYFYSAGVNIGIYYKL